jgi:hypothetical protein
VGATGDRPDLCADPAGSFGPRGTAGTQRIAAVAARSDGFDAAASHACGCGLAPATVGTHPALDGAGQVPPRPTAAGARGQGERGRPAGDKFGHQPAHGRWCAYIQNVGVVIESHSERAQRRPGGDRGVERGGDHIRGE